jgi:hypothetical protein
MAERTTRIEATTSDGRQHLWYVTRGGDIDDEWEYVGEVVTPSPSLLSIWRITSYRDVGLWFLFLVAVFVFWLFLVLSLPLEWSVRLCRLMDGDLEGLFGYGGKRE